MKRKVFIAALVAVVCTLVISGCAYRSSSLNSSNTTNEKTVDTSKLDKLISQYENYKESKFTPYSWKNFSSALSTAESMRNNDTADQSDIDRVKENLSDAAGDLMPAQDSTEYKELDYEDVVRNPNNHSKEYEIYSGTVTQVRGSGDVTITVAYNGSTDYLTSVSYSSDLLDSNVLVGDTVTIYGKLDHVANVTTEAGNSETIPVLEAAAIIDQSA